MPELPDLEVFSSNLQRELRGKTVSKISVPVKKNLNVPVARLKKSLEGQKIKKIYREGKQLHIEFSNGDVLGLHLMIHGDLHLFNEKNDHKYTVIELFFDDGTGLALTDWQQNARPTLNPEISSAPDALSEKVNASFLQKQFAKTRTTVKNFLLDQKRIRGIGNAYADEILWDAGLSPFSACNKLPVEKIGQLAKSLKKILKGAEKKIRKTNPGIIAGEVRDFMMIHNPKNKTSPTGAKIEFKKAGGRRTYYTKEQELFT
jgi:formamidopyrimidine-DNA glycosylase